MSEDLFNETENPAPVTVMQKINTIVDMVFNGEYNPLSAMILLNQLEKKAAENKDKIKELAIKEAEKQGAKTFDFGGAKITINEGRVMYKYDHINEWNLAKQKLTHIEELAKHSLQANKKALSSITNEGEVVTAAIENYSSKSLTIKINN